jgi:hypothetical protein
MKTLQEEADRVQEKGKYATKGGSRVSGPEQGSGETPAPASPAPAAGSGLASQSPMPRYKTKNKRVASDLLTNLVLGTESQLA